jgi:threonine/homoserine/homoserine lactone efflux protein
MDILTVLPLAIVMIAGPQIITAVFFATSQNWRANTAALLGGVILAVTFFVTVAYIVARLVTTGAGSAHEGTAKHVIDIVILVLLLFLVVYVFLDRKRAEPPKWMGRLETATPRFAFTLGLLLLGIFPTDIVTSTTVGARLARQEAPWWNCLPFILLTVFFMALPALLVLLLGRRAEIFLPKVRDWMNKNSWVVNEIVIVFFIAITIDSLAS